MTRMRGVGRYWSPVRFAPVVVGLGCGYHVNAGYELEPAALAPSTDTRADAPSGALPGDSPAEAGGGGRSSSPVVDAPTRASSGDASSAMGPPDPSPGAPTTHPPPR